MNDKIFVCALRCCEGRNTKPTKNCLQSNIKEEVKEKNISTISYIKSSKTLLEQEQIQLGEQKLVFYNQELEFNDQQQRKKKHECEQPDSSKYYTDRTKAWNEEAIRIDNFSKDFELQCARDRAKKQQRQQQLDFQAELCWKAQMLKMQLNKNNNKACEHGKIEYIGEQEKHLKNIGKSQEYNKKCEQDHTKKHTGYRQEKYLQNTEKSKDFSNESHMTYQHSGNSILNQIITGLKKMICLGGGKSENSKKRKLKLRKQSEYMRRKNEETPEARQIQLKKDRDRKRVEMENESEEKRKVRLQKTAENQRMYLENESEEKRKVRLQKTAENQRKYLENESKEKRKVRLQKLDENQRKYLENESEEKRKVRLQKTAENQRKYLENESKEKRKVRLQKLDENQRKYLENESEEKRKDRLQKIAENQRKYLENEPPEAKKKRLQESREYYAERTQINITAQFHSRINVIADSSCDFCTKMCYRNQACFVNVDLNNVPVYMPKALTNKNRLYLCHRCKTHFNSKKLLPPPKAYWNNLNPGEIPLEMQCISQAEQRLIARVIPFLKIVKYDGKFGQYGFKGQAILFAQDIFEITEKLPKMLPRSTDSTGLVVVTEELENLNKTREYRISKQRVNNALNWLIHNNPLYKDVKNMSQEINEDAQQKQFIREDKTPKTNQIFLKQGNVVRPIKISEVSRLIRGSWNQGNSLVFDSGYAGVQCCAMAIGSIVRANIVCPSTWTTNIINENLIESDLLYGYVRTACEQQNIQISTTGYLQVDNFDVIGNNYIMFNHKISLHYEIDTDIFGSLCDSKNVDIGIKLLDGLQKMFQSHSAGVLTANSKCYGLMLTNGKYYFTDSHSCGPKGAPARKNDGRACRIECDTIGELNRICKRATTSKNIAYTLNFVDVTTQKIDEYEKKVLVNENEAEKEVDMIPVQTFVMLPIDAQQYEEESILERVPQVGEEFNLNKIQRKTKDNIVNESHELKAEELAWYHLFPYGINGFRQRRDVRITPLDYFQFRVMGKDVRFQRNDYLFYALSMYEYYQIKTNISVCGKKITSNDGMVEDIHLYTKHLRGSAAYWNNAYNELIGQIRCLGPPQYFLTLSCNDLHWDDMIKALLVADNKPDTPVEAVNIFEVQSLIEKYPVVLSRQFMIRVNAFMSMLYKDETILGAKVTDHWWRIEFQNRGSPHLHLCIWSPDTPDPQTEEGIAHIDKIIKCTLPKNEQLRNLVESNQIHRHKETCFKNGKGNCRFNFPRAPSEKTKVVSAASEDSIRTGGRLCILKRRQGEEYINNYNEFILQQWKANMDIQTCANNEDIAKYIAKYLSKNEPTAIEKRLSEAIKMIKKEDSSISSRLFKICMRILKERQVSANECDFRLCHLKLKEASRQCIFLNTRKPEQRYKVLKFNNNEASGFFLNIFDRYIKRPYDPHPHYKFNTMSLTEFSMLFRPAKQQNKDDEGDNDAYDNDDETHSNQNPNTIITLTDNTVMEARKRHAVVRVPFFNEQTDPENYYYSLLAQYLPFRNEEELLEGFVSSKEAFLDREVLLRESSEYLETLRTRDKQLENAFTRAHALQALQEPVVELDSDDIENFDEAQDDPALKPEEQQRKIASCTLEQKQLLQFVINKINQQVIDSEQQIRLFVTGGAGTGKTFTLNLLKDLIRQKFEGDISTVKICALTGVAARLVKGQTIHSLLKLPVQRDGKLVNPQLLTGNYLKQMRLQWKNTKFLIIDEISMVPYEMLVMIDNRLKQLCNNDALFGGINVLTFGDLLQLPPVRGNAVYAQPSFMQPAVNLWRTFSFCELKENVRQKGDTVFIDLLNSLRFGVLKNEHISLLLKKVHTKLTQNDDFAIGRALRICPTNKLVDKHNSEALEYFREQKIEMNSIVAQDSLIDSTRQINENDIEKLIPEDINKTGGFPKQLHLFVGGKVMLRYNVDTSKGLVNGAIGEVTEIVWPLYRRAQLYKEDIPSVKINFEKIGEHVIVPRTVQFPAKFSAGTAERRMLPIVPCFASTVHKMQGSTVNRAVINLGSAIFAPGQAYVALSRVTSLDGIQLEEFDCTKIKGKTVCNESACKEMERLRKLPPYNSVIGEQPKGSQQSAVSNTQKKISHQTGPNWVDQTTSNNIKKTPLNEFEQSNKVAIFPNSFKTTIHGRTSYIKNLCPYNSLAYGWICLFKYDFQVNSVMESSTYPIFSTITNIVNSSRMKTKLWISFIRDIESSKFKLNPKNEYDMQGDVAEVSEVLHEALPSGVLRKQCLNVKCKFHNTKPISQFIARLEGTDLNQLPILLNDKTLFLNRCEKCKHQNNIVTFTFEDFIRIQVVRVGNTRVNEIRLKDIPQYIELNQQKYFFKFLIHFIPPTPGAIVGHYVCYCKIQKGILCLNDIGMTEEIVSPFAAVNPVFMVFSKLAS